MDDFKDRLTKLLGLDRESALAAQKQDVQAKLDEDNRRKIHQAALQHLMENATPDQLQNVSNSFKSIK